MRVALYRIGVFTVSLVAGVGSSFLIFVLGLFVPLPVVLPLTVAFSALCTALAAAWAANILSPDRSSSRILPVIAVTEASAAVAGLTLLTLTLLLRIEWPFPALPLLVLIVLIALAASFGAWRARTVSRRLWRDALASLGYLAVGLGTVVATVAIACSLVPCIP